MSGGPDTPKQPTISSAPEMLPVAATEGVEQLGASASALARISRFVESFRAACQPPELIEGIVGRVLRGNSATDFDTLSPDPDRRVVFMLGADGMHHLIGRSTSDVLRVVGYPEQEISAHSARGTNFKLLVCPAQTCDLATWENALAICEVAYPELAGHLVPHLDALQSRSIESIEPRPGYFSTIYARGRDDREFMTVERFLDSPKDLTSVRAFLYHTANLRAVFAGDGYTRTPTGERGVREYLCANTRISSLGMIELIDLPFGATT